MPKTGQLRIQVLLVPLLEAGGDDLSGEILVGQQHSVSLGGKPRRAQCFGGGWCEPKRARHRWAIGSRGSLSCRRPAVASTEAGGDDLSREILVGQQHSVSLGGKPRPAQCLRDRLGQTKRRRNGRLGRRRRISGYRRLSGRRRPSPTP